LAQDEASGRFLKRGARAPQILDKQKKEKTSHGGG